MVMGYILGYLLLVDIFNIVYLTIIPLVLVGYEMIDSQRGA